LVVPDGRVRRGRTWSAGIGNVRPDDVPTRGRFSASYEGLFHHKERDEDVAKLSFERLVTRSIHSDVGVRDLRTETQGTAFFSLDGYLAALDGTQRFFDPAEGITVSKLRVVWERAEPRTVAAPETSSTDDPCAPGYTGTAACTDRVQDITDPCDPDYVGPQACPDTPEPSTEPEAEEPAQPDPKPDPKKEPQPQPDPVAEDDEP
jgi:hypothetical protein